MKHFDDAADDTEQRIANDRVPLPASLRPRVLAAVGEAMKSPPASFRSSPRWRGEGVVAATSILLASLAFLVVVPSLVAGSGSGSGPILGSSRSSLEEQARRLGIDLPHVAPMPLPPETRTVVTVLPSHARPLTPADVRDVLAASF